MAELSDVELKIDPSTPPPQASQSHEMETEGRIAALGHQFNELRRDFKAELAAHAARICALERSADDAATGSSSTSPADPAADGAATGAVLSLETDAQPSVQAPRSRRHRLFVTRFARMLRGGEKKQKSGLAQSMWESPLFFGRSDEGMGRVVTVWAVFVLLLNTLVQATIAVIVVLKMGDGGIVARTVTDLWCASIGPSSSPFSVRFSRLAAASPASSGAQGVADERRPRPCEHRPRHQRAARSSGVLWLHGPAVLVPSQ
jgi:hypothetical protein